MTGASFAKRFTALCLTLMMLLSTSVAVFAEPAGAEETLPESDATQSETQEGQDEETDTDTDGEASYADVKNQYEQNGYPLGTEPIVIDPTTAVGNDGSVVTIGNHNDEEVFIWDYTNPGSTVGNQNTSYTWTFYVEQAGLYNLQFVYDALEGSYDEVKRDILIDGALPFEEARANPLYRKYVENGDVTQTDVGEGLEGDDIRPSLSEVFGWQTQLVYDPSLREALPLQFYLTEGEHTLTLNYRSQMLAIKEISFVPPEELMTYEQIKQYYAEQGYQNGVGSVRLEAEEITFRNSTSVRREYGTDPSTEPYSFERKVLNVMGAENWSAGGEAATWTVNVTQPGLYKIGFHVLQNWGDGLPSFRRLEINGEVPFAECAAIKFDYSSSYENVTLGGDDPWLFYLEPGDTLTLTVVMGDTADIIRQLEENVDRIMDLYSDIRIRTGTDPDPNYDYQLQRWIPNLQEILSELRTSMLQINEQLMAISNRRPGMVSNFNTIADLFEQLHSDTFQIPAELDQITKAATDITTWVTEMEAQSLEIDTIYFAAQNENFDIKEASFFDRIYKFFMEFWLSFFKDYNSIGVISGTQESIDVWISRGNEWCEVFREQVKRDFTPETGIGVNVNVLPNGQLSANGTSVLMLSYISGNAPDVVMGAAPTDAVEFSIRDAMTPLDELEGFEEVKSRFHESLFTPVIFEDHIYAIPESTNFLVMFYRTDIFDRIGIEAPETWDELCGVVIPALYENDMQFWYAGGFDVFLYQNGGSYYRSDVGTDGVEYDFMRTGLDTDAAYNAFVQWTDMYVEQGIPVTANFFNQFRSGDMPIGLGTFTEYMQFLIAAPEMQGKWTIAPIPGTVRTDENGNEYIDRTTTGTAGTYCFIMGNSQKVDSSWKMLEWWTRTDTQVYFGNEVEAVVGRDARWLPSNIEAFERMTWDSNHGEIIAEAQRLAVTTPNCLGSYFTARHVSNAFNRVAVTRTYRARDSLLMAVKDINQEIWNKREEYNREVPADAYTIS